MQVRRATRADIEAFSSVPHKPTMMAWAGEVGDKIVALGGLAFSNGRWVAFCDLDPEARKYKMTIARTAKRVFEEAERLGIRFIYADMDVSEPTAERWLESLGFRPDPRAPQLYRWGD